MFLEWHGGLAASHQQNTAMCRRCGDELSGGYVEVAVDIYVQRCGSALIQRSGYGELPKGMRPESITNCMRRDIQTYPIPGRLVLRVVLRRVRGAIAQLPVPPRASTPR